MTFTPRSTEEIIESIRDILKLPKGELIMNKEDEAKKHKSDPVYQSHLKGWKVSLTKPDFYDEPEFNEESEKFYKDMVNRTLHPEGKVVYAGTTPTDGETIEWQKPEYKDSTQKTIDDFRISQVVKNQPNEETVRLMCHSIGLDYDNWKLRQGIGTEDIKPSGCCSNPDKYKNVISASMQFYCCRNCGADLGNV